MVNYLELNRHFSLEMEGDVPSFYELGGYRENIRRYKEGIDQLVDIQAMVKVIF